MSELKELCKNEFTFLEDVGYSFIDANSDSNVGLKNGYCEIQIMFDVVGYELTCQFVSKGDYYFALQDALEYIPIKGLKGMYQIGDKSQMEKGVKYISDAIRRVMECVDINNNEIFNKIHQFRIEKHKELLEKYYLDTDMEKAEQLWNDKQYDKVKILYEKHKQRLTNSQKKKLECIINKIVK